jgi:hypothetical protein
MWRWKEKRLEMILSVKEKGWEQPRKKQKEKLIARDRSKTRKSGKGEEM